MLQVKLFPFQNLAFQHLPSTLLFLTGNFVLLWQPGSPILENVLSIVKKVYGTVATLLLFSWGASHSAEVLISAERLLDVRQGKMIQRPEILVRDGRIVEVRPNG